MTQLELEQLARKMRYRGLHYSWLELLDFSRDVISNLAEAYQTLLRDSSPPGDIYSDDSNSGLRTVSEKLALALTMLTSEKQVAMWRSTALSAADTSGTE